MSSHNIFYSLLLIVFIKFSGLFIIFDFPTFSGRISNFSEQKLADVVITFESRLSKSEHDLLFDATVSFRQIIQVELSGIGQLE